MEKGAWFREVLNMALVIGNQNERKLGVSIGSSLQWPDHEYVKVVLCHAAPPARIGHQM